ncbi:hypothetical protein EDD22DRAFT_956705 [Suillus occidentalis]|nr:hypothetical protein EDD22DRAFT_956705 [Suillus occidentalis]
MREPPKFVTVDQEKEVIAVNNLLSNIVFKPCPKPITKKVPTSSCVADSSTSGTTTSESTTTAPPSNNLSDTDPSSLAVKMELMAANHPKSIPPNTIDSKAQPIKKCQPSIKPMHISSKITVQNLCCPQLAIEWPNGLLSTDKEVDKRKVVQQLDFLPAIDNADEE